MLEETTDGRLIMIREENCQGCGALMKPRSAAQIVFTVRPDDEAPEEAEPVYFICPNGCAQCECYEIIRLNAACEKCGEINYGH